MTQEIMKIKINFDFGKYTKDQVVKVQSIDGMPTDKYWRDRIKDSEIDQCVSIVQSKKSKKTATSTNDTEQGKDK